MGKLECKHIAFFKGNDLELVNITLLLFRGSHGNTQLPGRLGNEVFSWVAICAAQRGMNVGVINNLQN